MTKDEKIELIKQGVKTGVYPEKVYKYRAINDRTSKIIETASMWFSNPFDFNDPFDCNLSEVKEHSIVEIERYLNRLPKDMPLTPEQISNILKRAESEPDVITGFCETARAGALNSKGILCLSKKFDDILMWSHYANCHTGIALGFAIAKDPQFFIDPFNVKYVSEYEPLNYFSKNRQQVVIANISTKSAHWAYEEEVRIISTPGAHSFDKSCLETMHFGCKTSDEDIEAIKKLCIKHDFGHVQFFRAKMKYGYFGLEFERI